MEKPVLSETRKIIQLRVSVESLACSLHSTIMAIFEFKFELKLELHNDFFSSTMI